MNLKDLEPVRMFRCVQDPMIGPRPRQAFMLPDLPDWQAWLHIQSGTIYVITNLGKRHAVGAGNWSSIEFYPETEAPLAKTIHEAQIRKVGRPRVIENGPA